MDNSYDFLYAEDDDDTAFLFRLVMNKIAPDLRYQIFANGRELLNYLYGEGGYRYPASPQPKFIITDLRMPGADGYEMLQTIRTNPKTYTLPVIVYTSSYNQTDVNKCYELGCNGYLIKPLSLEEKEKALKALIDYWFTFNTR